MGRNRSVSPEHAYHSVVLVHLAFCRQLPAFPRFSEIPGERRGGGWGGVRVRVRGGGLVTGSLRCLIERESYPAALQGQKVLHKRCMNIKQNYILASHTSTLADIFVSILF